jgi:hypothetical protein
MSHGQSPLGGLKQVCKVHSYVEYVVHVESTWGWTTHQAWPEPRPRHKLRVGAAGELLVEEWVERGAWAAADKGGKREGHPAAWKLGGKVAVG